MNGKQIEFPPKQTHVKSFEYAMLAFSIICVIIVLVDRARHGHRGRVPSHRLSGAPTPDAVTPSPDGQSWSPGPGSAAARRQVAPRWPRVASCWCSSLLRRHGPASTTRSGHPGPGDRDRQAAGRLHARRHADPAAAPGAHRQPFWIVSLSIPNGPNPRTRSGDWPWSAIDANTGKVVERREPAEEGQRRTRSATKEP